MVVIHSNAPRNTTKVWACCHSVNVIVSCTIYIVRHQKRQMGSTSHKDDISSPLANHGRNHTTMAHVGRLPTPRQHIPRPQPTPHNTIPYESSNIYIYIFIYIYIYFKIHTQTYAKYLNPTQTKDNKFIHPPLKITNLQYSHKNATHIKTFSQINYPNKYKPRNPTYTTKVGTTWPPLLGKTPLAMEQILSQYTPTFNQLPKAPTTRLQNKNPMACTKIRNYTPQGKKPKIIQPNNNHHTLHQKSPKY